MTDNKERIVVGIVGFLSSDDLPSFKQHLKKFERFRLVKFKQSDCKIWLVDQEEIKESRG